MEREEAADSPAPYRPDVLGRRIKLRREALGLSLRQLAERVTVSASFLSALENGKTRPSVMTIYSVCSALDITLDSLLEAASGSPDNAAPTLGAPRRSRSTGTTPPAVDLASNTASSTYPGIDWLVHARQRKRLVLDSGVTWELLAGGQGGGEFLYVVYEADGSSTSDDRKMRHAGNEVGIVLAGTLDVELGFEVHRLSVGDSICFPSSTPHRLVNREQSAVHAVWFVQGRDT